MNRREVLISSILTPFMNTAAFASDDGTEDEVPPLLADRADFGGVWSSESVGQIEAASPSPDLPDGYAEHFSSISFSNSLDVDNYFIKKTNKSFLRWFVDNINGTQYWAEIDVNLSDNLQRRFHAIFDARFKGMPLPRPSLLEFIAFFTVFMNETGGTLLSQTEKYNPPKKKAHPGIAYLYDRIELKTGNRPWTKQSYNKAPNYTCLELFNNADFNNTNKSKKLGDILCNTSDDVWKNVSYPVATYSASDDTSETGYVLEADFFKFRGRGIIQTTWRSNYKDIVEEVRNYAGRSDLIMRLKSSSKSLSADDVCTRTSTASWDALFQEFEIVEMAINLFVRSRHNLRLAASTGEINGKSMGSLIWFGDKVGGAGYGTRVLKPRVVQIATTLSS
jgi:hypothetical protein